MASRLSSPLSLLAVSRERNDNEGHAAVSPDSGNSPGMPGGSPMQLGATTTLQSPRQSRESAPPSREYGDSDGDLFTPPQGVRARRRRRSEVWGDTPTRSSSRTRPSEQVSASPEVPPPPAFFVRASGTNASESDKLRFIRAVEANKAKGISVAATTARWGFSKNAYAKYKKQDKLGETKPKVIPGRPQKSDDEIKAKLYEVNRAFQGGKTIKGLSKELLRIFGEYLSPSTICRMMRRGGWRKRKKRSSPFLTEKAMTARAEGTHTRTGSTHRKYFRTPVPR